MGVRESGITLCANQCFSVLCSVLTDIERRHAAHTLFILLSSSTSLYSSLGVCSSYVHRVPTMGACAPRNSRFGILPTLFLSLSISCFVDYYANHRCNREETKDEEVSGFASVKVSRREVQTTDAVSCEALS